MISPTTDPRGERGSVSVLAAAALIPLVLCIGLLVDLGLSWDTKTAVSQAARAAAAAAASGYRASPDDCAATGPGTPLALRAETAAAAVLGSRGVPAVEVVCEAAEDGAPPPVIRVRVTLAIERTAMALLSPGQTTVSASAAARRVGSEIAGASNTTGQYVFVR
jgi:Flp pilus assembly protein TadG